MKKNKYKIGGIYKIVDLKGNSYIARLVNINKFREPSLMYCFDIEGFEDYVFVGENQIQSELGNE